MLTHGRTAADIVYIAIARLVYLWQAQKYIMFNK